MVTLERSITIDRPVSEVFAKLADPTDWVNWRTGIKSVRSTSEGPMRVGSTYAIEGEAMGRGIAMTLEVTDYEVDKRLGVRSAGGPIQLESQFGFEASNGGTEIFMVAHVEAGSLFTLAGPLLRRRIDQEWDTELAALKAHLEL